MVTSANGYAIIQPPFSHPYSQAAGQVQDYKSIYDAWHTNLPVDAAADTPWHLMIRESLLDADLGGKNVLEIGCGRGGLACWIAGTRPEARLTAADFSPAAIAMGRSFADTAKLRNIDWCVADVQNLPWRDNFFDTVISCETIEHVPRPRAALGELSRVLRPGGKLFLTVPNYFNLAGLHRIYRKLLRGERFQEEGQPINHFTLLPQVCRWVRHADIKVSKIRSVNHSIPFPGRPGIVIRALAYAPFPFPWLGNNSMVVGVKNEAGRRE